jgi:hypothetical protein
MKAHLSIWSIYLDIDWESRDTTSSASSLNASTAGRSRRSRGPSSPASPGDVRVSKSRNADARRLGRPRGCAARSGRRTTNARLRAHVCVRADAPSEIPVSPSSRTTQPKSPRERAGKAGANRVRGSMTRTRSPRKDRRSANVMRGSWNGGGHLVGASPKARRLIGRRWMRAAAGHPLTYN